VTAPTVSHRAKKKAAGGYIGGRPPFGTIAQGGALVPIADEAKAVELIRKLRAAGMSSRAIAATLDRIGIPPRAGGTWQHRVILRILRRAETTDPDNERETRAPR